MARGAEGLDAARRELDVTFYELWVAYVSIGGCGDAFVLKGYLEGNLTPDALASPLDPDIIEQALTEIYLDLGLSSPFHSRS